VKNLLGFERISNKAIKQLIFPACLLHCGAAEATAAMR
jgi:hypothetical protein